MRTLESLGFNLVVMVVPTCQIGQLGLPLASEISDAIQKHKLIVSSILIRQSKFEGPYSQKTFKMNFLALVLAWFCLPNAIAGRDRIECIQGASSARTRTAKYVYLKDIWPRL